MIRSPYIEVLARSFFLLALVIDRYLLVPVRVHSCTHWCYGSPPRLKMGPPGHTHSHSHSHSHDDAPADGPEFRMPSEENLPGALIFFAYIAAALVFTTAILQEIRRLRRNLNSSAKHAKTVPSGIRTTKLTFLVIMATASFITLSYHMLNVLIQSYTSWTITHGRVDTSQIYSGLFPLSLVDYSIALTRSIWHWATTSRLFTDFATAILATNFRRIWTRLVLLYTLSWNSWMSDTGLQHHMPHLTFYFILAQILPISFTQSLFLLAFEFHRSLPNHKPDANPPTQNRTTYIASLILSIGTITLINRIDANLLSTSSLITKVLFIRFLLFLPLITPSLTRLFLSSPPPTSQPSTSDPSTVVPTQQLFSYPTTSIIATLALGTQMSTLLPLLRTPSARAQFAAAVDEHPAVSALGYDLGFAVVGMIGYAVLGLLEAGEEVREVGRAGEGQSDGMGKAQGEELLRRVEGNLKNAGKEVDASGLEVTEGEIGLQERLDRELRARGNGE
jgi:hypothetical protein